MSEEGKGKITLADVARLAGVSTSSVSNVLNGRSKRMRSSTEERIRHAIQKLGYTPNLAARQLKTGHSPIIGLIVPNVANPFFGIFARLIEEVALEKGYQVLLGNSDRDPVREFKYAEVLWGYGVKGIIFGSSLEELTHLEDLVKRGMHLVAFDRPAQKNDPYPVDNIGVDNVQAMRLVTKHLLALGHRRIGFISGPIRTVSRLARLEGYRSSLEEANIGFDQELVWEGVASNYGDVKSVELGKQGTHYLLSKSHPPTAIIAINDMYAFGVYAGVRDLGLRIPEDVSVTGVDDIALSQALEPPLTTVQQPIQEIARLTVERLLSRIQETYTGPPEHKVLSPKFIARASTARHREK